VSFRYLDHPRPLAFAHRGGAAGAPENTMRAFQRSVDLGYRYIETDVHTTADGTLVVFHDDTLDRLTELSGPVAELSDREIARARVHGAEPIPTLEEALATWPDVRFNIDLKEESAIVPFSRVLDRTGSRDRVCVVSFSQARLRHVRAAVGPGVCTALTRSRVAGLKITSLFAMLRRLARFGTPCVQVPPFYGPFAVITPSFLRAAHAYGMQVHAWTIDDAAQMHRLLDLGVDGIMTDEVETLRDVLVARDAWHPRPGSANPSGEPAP